MGGYIPSHLSYSKYISTSLSLRAIMFFSANPIININNYNSIKYRMSIRNLVCLQKEMKIYHAINAGVKEEEVLRGQSIVKIVIKGIEKLIGYAIELETENIIIKTETMLVKRCVNIEKRIGIN